MSSSIPESAARALVDNDPRGMHLYTMDEGDRLVFSGYNAAADGLLGVDHAAFLGMTLEEAFPALAGTEVPARYREVALAGPPWRTEQVDYREGRIAGAFEVLAYRIGPRTMVAAFDDITQRKRSEFELLSQPTFTKTVLDSLPGIFYFYEYPSLRLLYWNRDHEAALGYGPDELASMTIPDWYRPEDRAVVVAAIDRAMRDGNAQIEAELLSKDGVAHPYLLTANRFEADGRTYFMGVGIGIADRVAAEERLRKLNEELEDRVLARTRELEAAQRAVLAKEKLAALGSLVAGIAHELNTPLGAILSASETSRVAMLELGGALPFYRSLDGEERALFDALIPRADAPEPGREEARARKKAYRAALSGTERAALLAEQLVDCGFSGSASELASLARMGRFGRVVAAAHGLGAIVRADYVTRASAERAAMVVKALNAYVRREPGSSPAPSDVREQLDAVLTILSNRVKQCVEVVRDYDEVPRVPCYPDRLSQVWMNLVNNAVQAMRYSGRLELAVKAAVAEGIGPVVEVSVADDGPGIPEEARDRVFEPFFTTKPAGEGTGLGLDICRRILDEIGASIRFESRPGRTKFVVTLPIKDDTAT